MKIDRRKVQGSPAERACDCAPYSDQLESKYCRKCGRKTRLRLVGLNTRCTGGGWILVK